MIETQSINKAAGALSVLSWNARGLKSNIIDFKQFLSDNPNLDILLTQETKIRKKFKNAKNKWLL